MITGKHFFFKWVSVSVDNISSWCTYSRRTVVSWTANTAQTF